MSKMKPRIKKYSENEVTGQFRRCQSKSSNFISKKEKPVRRFEDINNDVFDLIPQGHTELFANPLKGFYYICEIKFQKNRRNV